MSRDPIPGSWFGFPTQGDQRFHPTAVGELVPDLYREDRARHAHRTSLYRKKPPPKYFVEVYCASEKGCIVPTFIFYPLNLDAATATRCVLSIVNGRHYVYGKDAV